MSETPSRLAEATKSALDEPALDVPAPDESAPDVPTPDESVADESVAAGVAEASTTSSAGEAEDEAEDEAPVEASDEDEAAAEGGVALVDLAGRRFLPRSLTIRRLPWWKAPHTDGPEFRSPELPIPHAQRRAPG
ncbi:hypothetical protein [Dactylosporangium sp. NPDC051541]|uniref:hypothetical protein n=1 Tax=Dactylosporangium sp. NPDC051541 TaxID=3363977 RepID=UPI003789C182